ncbi:MAG: monovalent cation/H+ antiporter subunit D family protein [Desulfobacteraceae bacterium]|nr:monovalent cation/H+ antiporter subunit D family protein [Desulfobacteraceae bacterium]
MIAVVSAKPLIAVLVSLAVIPVLISARKPNVREIWTFAAALIKFGIIASMVPAILAGHTLEFTIAPLFAGIAFKLKVDAFGLLFALVASFLWIVTSAYSIGYMRGLDEHSQTRYYCFFAAALSATIGVAFSANLLTLYIFYEILSLSTYPLVTHHQDREARSSGRKYLLYIMGGSIGLVLPAMIAIYLIAGSLDFAAGGILAGSIGALPAAALLLMLVFGFSKAGIMPVHAWLPAAMVAPTPVSALLHAVAVVKVGAFSVFRVITEIFGPGMLLNFGFDTLLCIIAAVTILGSSLIALSQDNLKRRLAFSTIGQLSYIILGAALLTQSGMAGGMLHIAMHAFGKITLFFCAGAIMVAAGVKNISEMKGLGRQMPVTMAAFFIGALSVIGLPPCGGFISKWYLAIGTIEAGQFLMLAVLLASSLLNAAYFLPIVYRAFFCSPDEVTFEPRIKEAPGWCLAPPVATAAISVILFFYPQPFFNLSQLAVSRILGG